MQLLLGRETAKECKHKTAKERKRALPRKNCNTHVWELANFEKSSENIPRFRELHQEWPSHYTGPLSRDRRYYLSDTPV